MNFKILSAYRVIISLFYSIYLELRYNVQLGDSVFFDKIPNIHLNKNCRLIIENNVRINSNNRRYHLNMHSRCKILLDKPDAAIFIGSNTRIHGSCIHAQKSIYIGKNCLIAANCQIIDSNGHLLSFDDVSNRINTYGVPKKIIINDNVWVGANCIILPGTIIGEGSVIGAGSIVNKEIPAYTFAAGNPIQLLKTFNK
jgi:acetyltransferase-like isoleucine patch superfamily enzyme